MTNNIHCNRLLLVILICTLKKFSYIKLKKYILTGNILTYKTDKIKCSTYHRGGNSAHRTDPSILSIYSNTKNLKRGYSYISLGRSTSEILKLGHKAINTSGYIRNNRGGGYSSSERACLACKRSWYPIPSTSNKMNK